MAIDPVIVSGTASARPTFTPFATQGVKKMTSADLKGIAVGNVSTTFPTNTPNVNFQKAAAPLQAVGSIAGSFSNMNGSLDEGSAQMRESLRGAIGQFGPWGAAISAATGVVDTLADSLGFAWNSVDTTAASRAGVGSEAGINNVLASLPGNSIWGALMGKTIDSEKSQFIDSMSGSYGASAQDINAAQKLAGKRVLFGKDKMNSFIREQNRVNSLMTSIGMQSEMAKHNDAGELYQTQNANKYAGYSPRLLMAKSGIKFQELDAARKLLKGIKNKSKETGLVVNAINSDINTLTHPDPRVNISSTSTLLAADTHDGKVSADELSILTKNQIYDQSQDPEGIAIKIVENIQDNKELLKKVLSKNGFDKVIPALDNANNIESLSLIKNALQHIIANRSYENGGNICKFQLGGKIDKNFIPQGALHKNKHHLEEVNPDLEGSITKKGIPVVSMEDGGITQHAEVEKNEIVFSLDTTKAIEEYYKQYQETGDENILVECGKFVANEIMKNTEDPGKLRKTIE